MAPCEEVVVSALDSKERGREVANVLFMSLSARVRGGLKSRSMQVVMGVGVLRPADASGYLQLFFPEAGTGPLGEARCGGGIETYWREGHGCCGRWWQSLLSSHIYPA